MTDRGGTLGRSAFTLGLLVLAAAALLALPPGSVAKAKTLADSGFRPATNGYSFANYGSAEGYQDLTAAQMRELFGDRVCATFVDGECVLIPTAQSWMESTNSQMAGGHCMGFASTSQLWFERLGRPQTPELFGSPTTPGLQIADNPPLQSHIAYAWSFQMLPSVRDATVQGKPRKIIRTLRESLGPGEAPYVVVIFDHQGGHAITPYAIRRRGNGLHRIWIYDNNHPDERRAIRVNTRRQTWSYRLAESVRWSGDAKTKSLGLMPPAPGLGHQPCSFCSADAAASSGSQPREARGLRASRLELRWQGDPETGEHGALFVADTRGRRSGCGANGCVNHIRGADMWETVTGPVRPWTLSPPPVFRLPGGRRYAVTLDGAPLRSPASEGIELIGNGYTLGADGVQLRKRERDRLLISRDGHRIVFDNDRHQIETPEIGLGTVAEDASYDFAIQAHRVRRGAQIGFEIQPDEQRLLIVPHDRSGRGRFSLTATRISDDGSDVFERTLEVRSNDGVVFDYGGLP